MKNNILALILIGISFTSGFTITQRIVDDIFMVMIVGYDYVDENLITGTAVSPDYKADRTIENIALTDTASLIYENRDKLEAKSPRPLLSGKLEAALFNRELAEHGIIDYIDNLQRDPSIGARVFLAVFDGSTQKILSQSFKDMPTGVYFSDLIEQSSKFDNLPVTNLHTFIYQYFAAGMDPLLPLLEETEEKNTKVNIKGLALFKDDKMVDEIEKKDFLFFRSLYEHFDNGTMFIKFDDEERAFLSTIKASKKVTVKDEKSNFNPKVSITLKMNGMIREYSGEKINRRIINNYERQINEKIEKKTNEMIKHFQELGIDPIGIGDYVSNYSRNWDEDKWKDIYPTLDITVNVEFTILEHGIIK